MGKEKKRAKSFKASKQLSLDNLPDAPKKASVEATGLVCGFIGDRKDLERLTVSELLDKSKEYAKFHCYPEALESSAPKGLGTNGLMKSCAKNLVGAA